MRPAPARRLLLLAALATAWRATAAQQAPDTLVLRRVALPAVPRHALPLDIAPDALALDAHPAQHRVVFSVLRSTAPIAMLSLLDPTQRVVWRRSPAELGLTPRQHAAQPELGDAIVLPELRDAMPGRWTLLIERGAAQAQAGVLQLAWRVLPRYALTLAASAQQVAAGQTLLLTLRPTDYGQPLRGLSPIAVSVHAVGGGPMPSPPPLQAVEGARSSQGIVISQEPGSYLAQLRLPRPGHYQVQASLALGEAPHRVQCHASLALQAVAPSATLRLAAVQAERAPGQDCVRAWLLRFELQLSRPGLHALSVLMRDGDPAAPRASASAQLAAGAARIELRLPADQLPPEGLPALLPRVRLLRLDADGAAVLVDLPDLPLGGLLPPSSGAGACR